MGELDAGTLSTVVHVLRDGGGWAVAALLIMSSVKGWITWPSEKRSMQKAIDLWQGIALDLLAIGKHSTSLAARIVKSTSEE